MKTLSTVAVASVLALLAARQAQPAQPLTPSALGACPFLTAEVEGALELKVEKAEASDLVAPGARDVGCIYSFKGSSIALSVRQIWDPSAPSPSAKKAPDRDLRPIKGDPDGAGWKIDKGNDKEEPSLELSYMRGNGKVKTRVLVHGGTFNVDDMQLKLLKLKRVP